jgi:hypothetical protein
MRDSLIRKLLVRAMLLTPYDRKYSLGNISLGRVDRIPWFFLLFVFLLFAGFSCAPTQQIVNIETEAKWLSYLEDGKTTKEDVLLRLGLPSAQFEGERILTYRMMPSEEEGLVVVSRELDARDPWLSQWARLAEYSLVLIFDDQHVLKRHSLVRVR